MMRTFVYAKIVLFLLCLASTPFAYSQDAEKSDEKKQPEDKSKAVKTPITAVPSSQQSSNTSETPADKEQSPPSTDEIDWGGWDSFSLDTSADTSANNDQFGVGITGKIEAELSLLDKSNLLENADGVITKETANTGHQGNKAKQKDLKKAMAELEAMEAKVKKEIEDDTEF